MSILITGGTTGDRNDRAKELAKDKYKISSFDTIFITGETSIGIGQIRELERQLALKPYNSKAKTAIIHPGEILTTEAQNALLKTLEETGETSIIILTAPTSEILLPTVVSRCQIIKLPTKTEIELDEKSIAAQTLLLTNIIKSGAGERITIASQIGKDRETIKDWLIKMVILCREILLFKEGRQKKTYSEIFLKSKELEKLSADKLIRIIKKTEETKNMVDQNINPRLALEVLLLDMPLFNSTC